MIVRNTISRLLEGLGHNLIEATHADEAIGLWEKEKNRISMVITDVMMPGKTTGFEMGRRFKSENPDLRVVYCTGHSSVLENLPRFLKGETLLRKPFSRNSLLNSIQKTDSPEQQRNAS